MSSAYSQTNSGVFTWQVGMPFPKENGVTIYPPIAPNGNSGVQKVIAGPDAATHWYAGTEDIGAKGQAVLMDTDITTGSSPSPTQFYYVLLSAWDNTGSYDQIGIADANGAWGFAYSSTTLSCTNPQYHFDPIALTLNSSQEYVFVMSIGANSSMPKDNTLSFAIYSNSKLLLVVYEIKTGVKFFYAQKLYCTTTDYQNYEEVWNTTKAGGVPSSSFVFSFNGWCTPPSCGSNGNIVWKAWKLADSGYSVPKKVKVKISGDAVEILN